MSGCPKCAVSQCWWHVNFFKTQSKWPNPLPPKHGEEIESDSSVLLWHKYHLPKDDFFSLHCWAKVTVYGFRWVCLGLIFCSLLLKLYVIVYNFFCNSVLFSRPSWVRPCCCLDLPSTHKQHQVQGDDKAGEEAVCYVPEKPVCKAYSLDEGQARSNRATIASGCNLYVPSAGIALLYLHLYDVYGDPAYLQVAHEYVKKSLRCMTRRSITFLCGDAGPLAVAAVIYHKLQNQKQAEDCIIR